MTRGFKEVGEKYIKNFEVFTDEKGRKHNFPIKPQLPVRADLASAGYDFHASKEVTVLPGHHSLIWTDVKAYMKQSELLEIHIRSSLAIKHGLKLVNIVGIVDSSYYENEDNDGNIAICIENTSGKAYTIRAKDRIAQGIFKEYLIAEDDEPTSEERKGGLGSSGK